MPRFLTRSHTEDITPDHLAYTVRTEGSVDPFNDEVVIENLDAHPIACPVITVNGRFNWSTVEALTAEITRGCATDEEKAMAIFNWVRTHGNHQYSGDIQSLNPVLFFNVFGYGICAYFASAQTGLARAAGLNARVWEIYRHTVGEIFYDGQWHMLDPDMQLFFLNPDNRTVASIEELEKDLGFYTRTEAYQRTFEDAYGHIRNEHQSKHDTFRYDLKHPRYVQYDYDPYIYAGWRMDYTLQPGERISRSWKGNGKHNDYREASRFKLNEEEPHKTWPPVQYGNGYVLFRLRPDHPEMVTCQEYRNIRCSAEGLLVDTPQDSRDGSRSCFIYRRPLPYLIVGGWVRGAAFREGDTAYDHVSLVGYKKAPGMEKQPLYQQELPGCHRFDINLDDFLYPGKGQYAYEHGIRAVLAAYAGNDPPTRTGLAELEVKTEFQVQPRSLPALSLGENRVEMLHGMPAGTPFRARITHIWTERHGIPTAAPPYPVAPVDAVALAGDGLSFRWEAVAGAVSYRFYLSPHHRCAFPLSPNFDVDLKGDRTALHVDASWFNPHTTYYWRVQARSSYGIWGPWSAIRSFTTGEQKGE
jgi:hypothetical protein